MANFAKAWRGAAHTSFPKRPMLLYSTCMGLFGIGVVSKRLKDLTMYAIFASMHVHIATCSLGTEYPTFRIRSVQSFTRTAFVASCWSGLQQR